MDVLHLTHQFAPETRGGVEAYLLDLAAEQRRRGLDAQVLTGSHAAWGEIGTEQFEHDGIPVHRLHRDDWYFDLHSKAYHPGVAAFLSEFVARHRPRVVHVHQWIRLTSNLVELVQAHGIPVVVTLHDFYTSCPRAFRMRPGANACRLPVSAASCRDCVPRYGHELPHEIDEGIELFAAQYRSELQLADAVLVGVGSTADLIARTLGVDRARFAVLPLGYRRRFPGQPPLPAPQPDQPFRFAFWGGVARHKGIEVLLEAMAWVRKARRELKTELHVLGGFATPELEQQLRQKAQRLPVVLHGPFTIPQLLAVAPHCGVFPSTCLETFGIVLDECCELGLPAIVSDHGALAERVGDGGLRAAAGNAMDLAAAMVRLMTEPGLWQQLRQGLPALPPDLPAHCQALDAVYQRAVEARGGRPGAPGAVPELRRSRFLLLQRESALRGRQPQDEAR